MKIFYIIINFLFIFIYWLLISGITFRILMKRRTAPSSMTWLLAIYIFPLVGIIAYLLLGELYLGKKRESRSKEIWPSTKKWIENLKNFRHIFSNENSEVARSVFKLCENRQGIGGLKSDNIQLLSNTEDAINELIRDIKQAKKNIEMVFYIWKIGGLVDKVSEALIERARRGVHCKLMLDSVGSMSFFQSSHLKIMRESGINIVEALHINILRVFLRRMDLRQHRKMILIDNHISYTGSMNMVDPSCFKKNSGVGKWIDMMVRIEGPVTVAMGMIYSCDWEIETGERILSPPIFKKISFNQSSNHIIQVIASGPSFPKGVIHQALLTAIYSARQQIVMTTPYLVPSNELLYAICTAAQRGVEVHIIVPRDNDSLLVCWASRSFFSELLSAGVLIHQFEGGLLHTKSIMIDEQLCLVGTANLDMRSLWLNFEIILVIDNNDFSNDLLKLQQSYIASSKLIDAKLWSKRPYWQHIIEKLFYFFSPLL